MTRVLHEELQLSPLRQSDSRLGNAHFLSWRLFVTTSVTAVDRLVNGGCIDGKAGVVPRAIRDGGRARCDGGGQGLRSYGDNGGGGLTGRIEKRAHRQGGTRSGRDEWRGDGRRDGGDGVRRHTGDDRTVGHASATIRHQHGGSRVHGEQRLGFHRDNGNGRAGSGPEGLRGGAGGEDGPGE